MILTIGILAGHLYPGMDGQIQLAFGDIRAFPFRRLCLVMFLGHNIPRKAVSLACCDYRDVTVRCKPFPFHHTLCTRTPEYFRAGNDHLCLTKRPFVGKNGSWNGSGG